MRSLISTARELIAQLNADKEAVIIGYVGRVRLIGVPLRVTW